MLKYITTNSPTLSKVSVSILVLSEDRENQPATLDRNLYVVFES